MYSFNTKYIHSIKDQLIFFLLPLFFVFGNLFINLAIFILILFKIKEIKNYIFSNESIDKLILYLVTAFFLLIICTTFFSEYFNQIGLKSVLYIRFFFLTIICYEILLKYSLNEKLKLSYFIFIIFIGFDVYIQFFLGQNIFGYEYDHAYKRAGGVFGDEKIVGNFCLYFGIISIYLLNDQIKNHKIINILFLVFVSSICFISGERNAFLSFFIFMFIFFILSKFNWKVFIPVLILSILVNFFLMNENLSKKYNLQNINSNAGYILKNKIDISNKPKEKKKFHIKFIEKLKSSPWIGHYKTSFVIFLNNPFTGSGFKTFRYECNKHENIEDNFLCSNHPHNLYLEILSDIGFLGLIIFLSIILRLCFLFFKKNRYSSYNSSIIFSLFLTFIFPLKPHGSLFSTSTAFTFFIILSLVVYDLVKKNNVKS